MGADIYSVKRILSNTKWKHLKDENLIRLIRQKSNSKRIKLNSRKFTNYQILEIRSKFENNYSLVQLSTEYGVSHGVIFGIIKHKTYKEIK